MNYRKISSLIADSLKPAEAYTFFCLAMKSDRETLVSYVNQDTLAEYVGVDARTIQRHLKKMDGLVTTEIHHGTHNGQPFKKNVYTLINEHYVLIDEKLVAEPISRELKGFLILLKMRCVNNTNVCAYSTQQLAETLQCGKSTVNRYLTEAEEKGYIRWNKKKHEITLLKDDVFIITRESDVAMMRRVYPQALLDKEDIEP